MLGTIRKPVEFQQAIRKGLPYTALEALATVLKLNQGVITAALGIAPRTLARRKQEQHLTPIESDRLYRLARIIQLAAEALGDLDQARVWLARGNRALGGQTPLSMLDTEIGARQVEEALLRINYGMYS